MTKKQYLIDMQPQTVLNITDSYHLPDSVTVLHPNGYRN